MGSAMAGVLAGQRLWAAVPAGGQRRPGAARSGDQRGPETFLADPPEIVLNAINQCDRDHLRVLGEVGGGGRYVPLIPADAKLGRYPGYDRAGIVAQVTAGTGQQRDLVIGGAQRYSRVPLPG